MDGWQERPPFCGRAELPLRARSRPPANPSPASAKTAASICARAWAAITQQQSVALTTPGIVYKDLIIVGGRNPETYPAPPGDIRAFDVRTGEAALDLPYHPASRRIRLRHLADGRLERLPAPPTTGPAWRWTPQRGIVYVPTGSAAFDFYGGDRIGDDLFANTLLALDAATGKRLWHFQGVHHDIWDRDFPAPPALVTVSATARPWTPWRRPPSRAVVYLFDRAHRQAALPHRGARLPAQRRARRKDVAHATHARCARALRAPAADRRHADQPHARSPRLGAPDVSDFPQRRPVHPLRCRSPDRRLSRLRWRRGMGRSRRRSCRPGFFTSTPTKWPGPVA